ncbi:MAG: Hsp20/alpha crystallin family protein [Saccharofermentanales bacterium]|jgi:HSP20 family protein|nr:Hsp20/alpha crystallin family protein [Clostridiaceae bacterium]
MFELVPFNRRRNQIQSRNRDIFDFDRLINSFFNDSVFPSYFSQSGQMKVDIRDEGDSFVLETDLPGIKKENINIEIDEDRLTIAVNQEEQDEETRDNYLCRERRSCVMRRSFNIDRVDADNVSATFENGLLTLTLPKLEPAKPIGRKIEIE